MAHRSSQELAVDAPASDHSLLRRFRGGESEAATELYARYAERLMGIARRKSSGQLAARFDAEDVIQSVFRTFFRRAAEGNFAVPPGDELWQLLLVIALNKVRHLGRFHRRQRRDVGQTVGTAAATTVADTERGNSLQILQWVITETLEQFPEVQQRMIELRIQGHTVAEIATETGRCRRTIERVLRQFRELISDHIDDDRTSPSDPASGSSTPTG